MSNIHRIQPQNPASSSSSHSNPPALHGDPNPLTRSLPLEIQMRRLQRLPYLPWNRRTGSPNAGSESRFGPRARKEMGGGERNGMDLGFLGTTRSRWKRFRRFSNSSDVLARFLFKSLSDFFPIRKESGRPLGCILCCTRPRRGFGLCKIWWAKLAPQRDEGCIFGAQERFRFLHANPPLDYPSHTLKHSECHHHSFVYIISQTING